MFSMLAIGYLFLGGAGAGALVVLSLLECANAQRRFGYADDRSRLGRTFAGRAIGPLRTEATGRAGELRYYEGFLSSRAAEEAYRHAGRRPVSRALAFPSAFFSYAWLVCLIALALGALCLLADLGRPDRVLVLLLSPRFSVMTVGAYALALSLIIAAVFAIGANFDGFTPTPTLVYALGAAGAVAGLVCAAYTGVLLASLASVLFWQTWLLPATFLLSSLSCGMALAMSAASFVNARQVIERPLRWLARFDGALIVLETGMLVALIIWGLAGEGTRAAAHAFLSGNLAGTFWGGVVVLGLAVPFAMERYIAHGNYSSQLVWIAAMVLLGGFALRWCMVAVGSYDATQVQADFYGMTQLQDVVYGSAALAVGR